MAIMIAQGICMLKHNPAAWVSENSDVLPAESMAVAVMCVQDRTGKVTGMVKLPLGSAVVVSMYIWPSP
jgi:hypothetical protein